MSSCVLEFAQAAEHKMNNVQSFVISTARLAQSAERKALKWLWVRAPRWVYWCGCYHDKWQKATILIGHVARVTENVASGCSVRRRLFGLVA